MVCTLCAYFQQDALERVLRQFQGCQLSGSEYGGLKVFLQPSGSVRLVQKFEAEIRKKALGRGITQVKRVNVSCGGKWRGIAKIRICARLVNRVLVVYKISHPAVW